MHQGRCLVAVRVGAACGCAIKSLFFRRSPSWVSRRCALSQIKFFCDVMMLKPIFHSSNYRDAVLFKSVAIAVSVLASGCGGGGGGDSVISTGISGRVMDGYIRGAIVFWDCNNDMRLNSGEVGTISSEGGKYTISVPPSSACVLRAEIPGSATDSDTGAAIGRSYTMSAINGRPGIISPLTTVVEMGGNFGGAVESIFARRVIG